MYNLSILAFHIAKHIDFLFKWSQLVCSTGDDSDDLPTILPPKRRRQRLLQITTAKVGAPPSATNTQTNRISQELPRHNWLENKLNKQDSAQCQDTTKDDTVDDTAVADEGSTHKADIQCHYTAPPLPTQSNINT